MSQEVKIHLPKHDFKVGDYLCYLTEIKALKECDKQNEFCEDILDLCKHRRIGYVVLQTNDLFAVIATTHVSTLVEVSLNRIIVVPILELATKFTLASHVNLIFV